MSFLIKDRYVGVHSTSWLRRPKGGETMKQRFVPSDVLVRLRSAGAALIPIALGFAMTCLAAEDGSVKDKPLPGITGTLKYHDKFASKCVEARNVNVWLPPSYAQNAEQRYAV